LYAVISDIHGNLEALRAVAEDIATRSVRAILCLGDVVGYGPDPAACVDWVMEKAAHCLLGNHEAATLHSPTGFNAVAEASILWTRCVLDAEPDEARRYARKQWIAARPAKLVYDGLLLVHGSPRRPTDEYIFPEDITARGGPLRSLFNWFNGICLVGHTHVAGVFAEGADFLSSRNITTPWRFPSGGKVIINVGSVGQPRDGDPRACYALIDRGSVRFIRVPYDTSVTAAKLTAVPELSSLAARLVNGR
jgi:diadenosine tetraphosphatase ApaH/serine/threonine PP2A family protein phosphatase